MKIIVIICLIQIILVSSLKAYQNSSWTLRYNLFSKLARDQEYNFLADNPEISLKCRKATKNLVQSLLKVWAIKMMDATAKIPSGIFSGNANNFGDRKACTRIYGSEQGSENGRYYLVYFMEKVSETGVVTFLMETGSYQHGFCLPQACSPKDVSIGLQTFTGFDVKIIIDDYQEHSLEFEGLEIAFTTLIVFILLFVLAGTMCELYSNVLKKELDREIFRFLLLFSVISSTKDLFNIPQTTTNNKKRLNSLDGMRFLSITWVLIGHSFSASTQRMEDIFVAVKDVLGEYFGQGIFNAFNSVDTFFVLSGLLVSYLTIKELERNNGTVNWFLFYFHRYVRITLVYSIIIFMFASVLRHLGPTNNIIKETVDSCRKHSWEHLLYIENLVSHDFHCIGQGWYLNCDMQMFLITPLILYPLHRWEKIGFMIGTIFILGSTGLLATFHFIKRDVWGATIFGSDDDYFELNYTQPWMRIQPYIVGVFLGYTLFKTKSSYQIPKYVVAIGWLLAIVASYASIYSLHLNEYFEGMAYLTMPLPIRIAYGSLHRLGWALAVGWVIFACENGYGGIINEFLSWNFFKPWSKLTFLIYLIHMIITDLIFDNMTFTTRSSPMSFLITILGILNISAVFSALLYIFFEVPFSKLEKYFVSKIFARKKRLEP